MKEVWPDSFVEEGNLTRNISTLRKALGEKPDERRFIETFHRRGYRFVAAVREFGNEDSGLVLREETSVRVLVEEEWAVAPAEPVTDAARAEVSGPSVVGTPVRGEQTARRRLAVTVVVLTVALGVGAALFVARQRFAGRAETFDSIAVLPFMNANADPNVEYLSEGLTESIINSLTRLPELRVASRPMVLRYKGLEFDPQEAGRNLNVKAVLMGKVLQRNDTLIVQVDLVNVSDGAQLWGEQYTPKLADLVSLQPDIAKKVTGVLRLKLTDEEKGLLTKRNTENTEAYQAYLKGRYFWNRRTAADYGKGIEHFKRAIDIDAGYAPAYAGLADCYNLLSEYDILSPNEAIPQARAAALKALALDDTLAEAHTSMAHILMYYDWDWPRGEDEFRRALDLDPNYATAHQWYAEYLAGMGRFAAAMPEMRRALALDPNSIMLNLMVGWVSLTARDYDAAIEQYRRALEMDSNYAQTHFALATAYRLKGMYQESVPEFQKWAALTGNTDLLAVYLADVYAGWGKQREAREALRRLEERAKQHYVPASYLAYIYAGLGDEEHAFQSLDKVCEERVGVLFLKTDPRLDRLRPDPRFANLLRRVRLAS
jgi:TolB-like protein/Tfp pilus assembly protein PilF